MASEFELVKRPYTSETYTPEMIEEITKSAADPIYFIKTHMYIQHPTKGRVKFDLFDYQVDLLDCYHNNRYSINMLGRQMGKSTCAAGYLLWYAMFIPDSTILIAAHKHTGAQEIMQRIRYMYENLPNYLRAGATSYNKGSLEFDNGSRIVSATTTENTGRGMSLTLVYLDEFAFVKPRIATEFWTSLSPTLSTGGKCIITSTPNSDDDQFAQIWKLANKTIDEYGNDTGVGVNGFKSIMFDWSRHPERDQVWADAERNKIGEERFRREHLCEFIVFDETLINSLKLAELAGVDPILKAGQVRYYRHIEGSKTFVLGWDPSLGTGGDYAAVQVYQLPEMVQVAEWQHNKTDIKGQLRIIRDIILYIDHEIKNQKQKGEIYWSVENNTIGEAALMAIREMGEENIPATFLTEPGKQRRGFTTSFKTKIAACAKFKYWIENDKMKVSSKNLIREMKNFIAAGQSFAAKQGETDDLVMASILSVRMIQLLMNWDQHLFERLQDEVEKAEIMMPMPIGL
jgi:Terminase large subunit, T4likevirus-type, N-terminal/Terminase RNaseH-like domain